MSSNLKQDVALIPERVDSRSFLNSFLAKNENFDPETETLDVDGKKVKVEMKKRSFLGRRVLGSFNPWTRRIVVYEGGEEPTLPTLYHEIGHARDKSLKYPFITSVLATMLTISALFYDIANHTEYSRYALIPLMATSTYLVLTKMKQEKKAEEFAKDRMRQLIDYEEEELARIFRV